VEHNITTGITAYGTRQIVTALRFLVVKQVFNQF